jgi:hypothetical protein
MSYQNHLRSPKITSHHEGLRLSSVRAGALPITTTLVSQFIVATGHYCQRVHTSTAAHPINVC